MNSPVPDPSHHTGLKRLVNATFYSVNGFKACFKTEEAFRLEVYLALIMIPVGLWIGEGGVEKTLLVISVLLVLIVEILNTAVERAIDRISPEKHLLSKESKDMGSTAVFFSLFLAGITWALIALPRLFHTIFG